MSDRPESDDTEQPHAGQSSGDLQPGPETGAGVDVDEDDDGA